MSRLLTISLWSLALSAGSVPATELVLLPARNDSGRAEALQLVEPLLEAALRSDGFTPISAHALRPFLREHRIRAVGRIGRSAMELVGVEHEGARLLLWGIDRYRNDGAFELGVSARVLDPDSGRLIAAASAGATSRSFESSFGRQLDASPEFVINRVLAELIRQIQVDRTHTARAPRIALVRFDDAADTDFADEIFAAGLIAQLLARGYDVVEPGFVEELLLREGWAPRGSIHREAMQLLHRELAADFAITGSVLRLEPARGDLVVSSPELAFSARLLDLAEPRLLAGLELELQGADSERLFGNNRTTALSRLIADGCSKLLDAWNEQLREAKYARHQP